MKIYVSKHDVEEVNYDKTTNSDIPLACINTDNSDFNYYVKKESSFLNDSVDLIKPYTVFKTSDVLLFDNNMNKIDTELKEDKVNNGFVYIPQGSKEFAPLQFTYKMMIKKKLQYASSKLYNLAVAATGDMAFVQSLMPLFGDAPLRGLCPGNISVNGGDQQISSLGKTSFKNQDIFFIETTDGITYDGKKLDIEGMLEANTNVWLCVDSFDSTLIKNDISKVSYVNNIIYKIQDYDLKLDNSFDITKENINYPAATYKYINLFNGPCPILILQKENGGYVIVSQKSLLNTSNSNLIYEIMMYVVLNGYYSTEEKMSWITDNTVDYLFGTEIFNRKHPEIKISTLLNNGRYNIDNFSLVNITTSTGVNLQSMNYNGELFFIKDNTFPDPDKDPGSISTYTTKHSVLIYKDIVIKKIETNLNITIDTSSDIHYIIIGKCISSNNNIIETKETKLQIPNKNRELIVSYNSGFIATDSKQYNPELHGLKIATITPIHKIKTVKYDTRICGGGIPESEEDDYNLEDISNRYGRPLRNGLTRVMRLPLKYKPYESRIREEVSRHLASGEFMAIIFEDI